MRCLYGTWHDWTNPMPLHRDLLIAYCFFYENIIDDVGMVEPLTFLTSAAKAFENGTTPMLSSDSLQFVTFPRHILDYLLREVTSLCGESNREDLMSFIRDVSLEGKTFYEGDYLPEDDEEWSSMENSKKELLNSDFRNLVNKFFLFVDHIGHLDFFIRSAIELQSFVKNIVISSDLVPINDHRRELERNALKQVRWADGEVFNPDESTRLLALSRSAEMGAHYACQNDPFSIRGTSYTTTTISYPSLVNCSFKDLLDIRNTDEWATMIKLFDAHHSRPMDRHLSLDFQHSLEGLRSLWGSKRKSSLIGSALAFGSTIPLIGSLISAGQAVKDFFQYLKLRKTVFVTNTTNEATDEETSGPKVYVGYRKSQQKLEGPLFLSTSSAHELTSLSKTRLRQLAREGKIEGHKSEGQWCISRESLLRYLED